MRNASRMARYMMMQQTREGGGKDSGKNTRNEYRGGESMRSEYGGGMANVHPRIEDGHEPESRFRDKRGREHYDNGRYAPQNAYTPEYRVENDTQNRQGQRRSEYRARDGMERGTRSGYEEDEEYHRGGAMNMIGFGERETVEWERPIRGMSVEYNDTHEMERHKGQRMNGGAEGSEMQLTPELAEKWTKTMKNNDGSTGPHWNMEQTRQLAQQRGVNAEPAEFYAIVNAMYSDYCDVAKKHNVHNADFYVDMAKAWLRDKDAVPNKAAVYYECVVKH